MSHAAPPGGGSQTELFDAPPAKGDASSPDHPTRTPDDTALDEIEDLYARGLYRQAWERGQAVSPLRDWQGTRARIMGGRLATHLGDARLGDALFVLAWRGDREDARACAYYGRVLIDALGILPARRHLDRHDDFPDASPSARGDWLALKARLLGRLRDFDRAEEWMRRAEAAAPNDPWVVLERAWLMTAQDQLPAAIEVMRRALSMRPWYRPAVQALAHGLLELDQRAEARALLEAASTRLESGAVEIQRLNLMMAERDWAAARRQVERVEAMMPLASRRTKEWLAGVRSDIAYALGEIKAAVGHARLAGRGFYERIAETLSSPPSFSPPVLIDLPFVRQHHNTCGPATLASIAPYWNVPVDHLSIAQAICYDGTPDHEERSWAERNGWAVREFTVDWSSASALLDRGVPFTVTTVEPTSAHLQALVGYDPQRRTFRIRDPSGHGLVEYLADSFLERHRSTGPRGMALVPVDEVDRFEGIEFPEAGLYDRMYVLKRLLAGHDRENAERIVEELEREQPDHPFTLRSRWTLAIYDQDAATGLATVERLLEIHPDDEILELRRLSYLRNLGHRSDRLAQMEAIVARPGSDPIFSQQYAEELRRDARAWDQAEWHARRAIRRRPDEASAYHTLASILHAQHQFDEAFELYRLAACIGDTEEWLQEAFCQAARALHREDEALAFLRRRSERVGTASSLPVRTEFWMLSILNRVGPAFEVLDRALESHAGDADLELFAAREYSNVGNHARALHLLEEAQGHAKRSLWERTAARLARARGAPQEALEHWQGVARREPHSVEAHEEIAQLLAQSRGAAAARAYLIERVEERPRDLGLQRMVVGWLRRHDERRAEEVLRRILLQDESDCWARRELALCLVAQDRLGEALAEAGVARRRDPQAAASAGVVGFVLECSGDIAGAARAYREALALDVDGRSALEGLMRTCRGSEEREAALEFFSRCLEEQVVFGDGLAAYREAARATVESDRVGELLAAARRARPDLWQAVSESIRHALDSGAIDEARALAEEAVERFPAVPDLWVDLSHVRQAQGAPGPRREALERALGLAPDWAWAARELAITLQDMGQLDDARFVLEASLLRSPHDAYHHGCLADVLWRQDEHAAAIDRIEQALHLDPDYGWAWMTHADWCREEARPGRTVDLACEIATERAGDVDAWLALARARLQYSDADAEAPEGEDPALIALDRAIALDPRAVAAHDLRARRLAELERFDEAAAACTPASIPRPPASLRARAAWVEAQRGDRDEAIRRMREVVADHPDLYWGWTCLADWYEAAEDREHAIEACRRMVKLEPRSAESWGYLGGALDLAGDRPGAIDALHRALSLSPEFHWARFTLFDALFEEKRLEEAQACVDALVTAPGGPYALARAVQVATARGELDRARVHFDTLLAEDRDESWPLDTALDALLEVDRVGILAHVEAAIPVQRPPERIVHRWLEVVALEDRDFGRCEAVLFGWQEASPEPDPATRHAISRYIELLAEATAERQLQGFRKRHEARLRADTLLWATCGYALITLRDYKAARGWLADWETRDGLEPWMLLNVVAAERHSGSWELAGRVSERAVALAGDTHRADEHLIWLAFDDAIAGRLPAESRRRGEIDAAHVSRYFHFLIGLTALIHRLAETEPRDRRRVFRALRERFDEDCRAYGRLGREHALLRAARSTARRLAALDGGVAAKVWAARRQLVMG